MMFQMIKQLFITSILGIVVLSCSDELQKDSKPETWQGNVSLPLELKAAPVTYAGNISRSATVDVIEGNESTYKISDFVIFQFDEKGNRIVDPKYYEFPTNGTLPSIPVVLPTDENINYTIVVLANYHNSSANITFADATTLEKLMNKYQKFEKEADAYKTNGNQYDLLMNGYTTINKNTKQLDVILYRNVAKVTLSITNTKNSGVTLRTVQVKSVPSKIDYFYHLITQMNPGMLTTPYPKRSSFTTFNYDLENINVAPGQTKDITYYLPCHLMGELQYPTEEKLKGNYAPDYATYIELHGLNNDNSQFVCYRFHLGENMTNNYNITPNYHYKLPITFKSIGDPQMDPRVELMDAIVTEPEANCYIINPLPTDEQRTYSIPVAKRINTFWVNEEDAKHIPSATGYTIAQESEWAAEIIWQTSPNQMIEFCKTDGTLTDNGGLTPPIYTGVQTLKFKPKKNANGSVLIGVYRTDQQTSEREYSWSWHLWITDYNPDECLNQNWDGRYRIIQKNGSGEVHHYIGTSWDSEDAIYHNKWLMDRNIGAKKATGSQTEATGLCYQFGRKDPLPQNGWVYVYDSANHSFKSKKLSTIESSNEYLHILTTKYPQHMYNTNIFKNNPYYLNIWDDPDWSKALQGGKTKKSYFDPCPSGWKITSSNVWDKYYKQNMANLTSTGFGCLFYDNNLNGDYVAWFPKSGGCFPKFSAVQEIRHCYTSNPASLTHGLFMGIVRWNKGIYVDICVREDAMNIRSIQE